MKGLPFQDVFLHTFNTSADNMPPGMSLYYKLLFFRLVDTHKQLEAYNTYKCINHNMSQTMFNNILPISCSWTVDFESSLFSIIYS